MFVFFPRGSRKYGLLTARSELLGGPGEGLLALLGALVSPPLLLGLPGCGRDDGGENMREERDTNAQAERGETKQRRVER